MTWGPAVAGLDLSLTSTGLALVDEGKLTSVARIATTGTKADTLLDRRRRMVLIQRQVEDFLRLGYPDLAVVESPSYGSKFGSPHDRSGLWWRVVELLMSWGIPVATVVPQGRAMYATGNGASKKPAVLAAVKARYLDVDWPKGGKHDDVADAILLASMGARWMGYPIEELPATHTRALDGAAWPNMGLVA